MTDYEFLKELLSQSKEMAKYHEGEVKAYKKIIASTRKRINELKDNNYGLE